MELLRYLAQNAGRAVSRDEILARVWRLDPSGITTRTIDMHIARLREKLRDDTAKPSVVLTVRGKGYMFAQPGVS
jgi:DNA-binding response OmpR family regulator